jgi:hypothetical protein
VLPKPDAPVPPPQPAPSHHGRSEPAAHAKSSGAGGTRGAPGATGGAAGTGAPIVAGAGGGTGESGAAVVKPYRPPPDSGILFLDLQGGAPRAP